MFQELHSREKFQHNNGRAGPLDTDAVALYSTLSHLYNAMSLWLRETTKIIGTMPETLPERYCIPRLKDVLGGMVLQTDVQVTGWFDLVPVRGMVARLRDIATIDDDVWESASTSFSTDTAVTGGDGGGDMTGETSAYGTIATLTKFPAPLSPLEFTLRNPLIHPPKSEFTVVEVEKIFDVDVPILVDRAKGFRSFVQQHAGIDESYIDNLTKLYSNETKRGRMEKSCSRKTSGGSTGGGGGGCSGPAVFDYRYQEVRLSGEIKAFLRDNRHQAESLMTGDGMIDPKVCVSALKLIRALDWLCEKKGEDGFGDDAQADKENGGGEIQKKMPSGKAKGKKSAKRDELGATKQKMTTAIKIFFQAVTSLADAGVRDFPPATLVLDRVVQSLGKRYIANSPAETKKVFELLTSKPSSLSSSIMNFFRKGPQTVCVLSNFTALLAPVFNPAVVSDQFASMYKRVSEAGLAALKEEKKAVRRASSGSLSSVASSSSPRSRQRRSIILEDMSAEEATKMLLMRFDVAAWIKQGIGEKLQTQPELLELMETVVDALVQLSELMARRDLKSISDAEAQRKYGESPSDDSEVGDETSVTVKASPSDSSPWSKPGSSVMIQHRKTLTDLLSNAFPDLIVDTTQRLIQLAMEGCIDPGVLKDLVSVLYGRDHQEQQIVSSFDRDLMLRNTTELVAVDLSRETMMKLISVVTQEISKIFTQNAESTWFQRRREQRERRGFEDGTEEDADKMEPNIYMVMKPYFTDVLDLYTILFSSQSLYSMMSEIHREEIWAALTGEFMPWFGVKKEQTTFVYVRGWAAPDTSAPAGDSSDTTPSSLLHSHSDSQMPTHLTTLFVQLTKKFSFCSSGILNQSLRAGGGGKQTRFPLLLWQFYSMLLDAQCPDYVLE
ncbi:hypothetical protein HK102_007270, partial [Quaeritorhiza haematococci]